MDVFDRNGFLKISQEYLANLRPGLMRQNRVSPDCLRQEIQGGTMKIAGRDVHVFKIKNRSGYAAVCCDHLTEGSTSNQALERMEKALRRTCKKQK